jgi:hypothetical protein
MPKRTKPRLRISVFRMYLETPGDLPRGLKLGRFVNHPLYIDQYRYARGTGEFDFGFQRLPYSVGAVVLSTTFNVSLSSSHGKQADG